MDRFDSDALDASNGAQRPVEDSRSLGEDVREQLRRFADRRKDAVAAGLDELAAECVRGAQNLERAQPATAAVLRGIGARLGAFAESLEERPLNELARRLGRGIGDNPLLFVGGLVGGAILGSAVFGAQRRTRS